MKKLNRATSEKAKYDFKLIDLAVKNKNQEAYAELMDRYQKPVYYMIYKMVRKSEDAEDLTIEAFAKAFKNLSKFKKDYTFSTWLFRIATNNVIDFIRKKKLDTFSMNSSMSADGKNDFSNIDIRDENLAPDEEAIREQKIEVIRMFVDKLSPKYHRLVKLRYFDELSYEEIATLLDAPLGTIKAQLFRARELMYELLKDKKQHI